MKRVFFCLLALTFTTLAAAQGTRLWKEASYEEFERGTARGVAIRSNGKLELAPAFKVQYTSPATFIWSITSDKDGVVYAATGAPARVYRISPDGKDTVIFEPKELEVQAIAMGPDGALYAATSPDGKVYKLSRKKSGAAFNSEVFFDPEAKYIWDMAFDSQGRLYLATGDRGEIFRVDKNGEGSIFFKSDEAHIRVLAFDPKGNLIAGSDGSGLIYRITPSGEGFVLYSAPKKEITALAVDSSGNIFAAGAGDKRPATQGASPAIPIPLINPTGQPPGPGIAPLPPSMNLAGSDVYRIAPDGSPRKLWSSHDDIVYALALDASGHLIAGTGNKGRIYSIFSNGDYVDLLKASANQITAFSKAPNGSLYCSSSNLGKIFLMSDAPESEGTFESEVEDAHIFSRWGRAEVRAHGNYEIFARSGNVDNPDRNWSPWMRVEAAKDWRLDVPAARFLQWRAVLKPATPPTQVEEVDVNYLSLNVAPVVEEVAVQAGARFPLPPHLSGSDTVTVNFGSSSNPSVKPHVESPSTATRDRGYIAVRWAAHDDNDDDLDYSIYYRGESEHDWKLLKSGITDKVYSFESNLLPDGAYVLKVVASDAPSHTPQDALTDEKESARFVVDNTPPRIQNLTVKIDGQKLHVTFSATDDTSVIQRAEYSIDAGEWQHLEPIGQISDSRTENYDFGAPLTLPEPSLETPTDQTRGHAAKKSSPPATEHVVVVRVYDRFDNETTGKFVVR